jgi:kynurenine formamidase
VTPNRTVDIDFSKLPKFDELPIAPDKPPESNWGVFGEDDEVGCANLLTSEGIIAATKLVRRGAVFRLDTPIGYAVPPLFGREPVRHKVQSFREQGYLAYDDLLDNYNTQEGAQWDGLGHAGHAGHDAFYNGASADEIEGKGSPGKLGVHLWADKLVGRGVLLDLMAYREAEGRPLNPGAAESYGVGDLEGALARQHTEISDGSILLVRTGWMRHYIESGIEDKQRMSTFAGLKACGLEASRDLVAWLWDHRVGAVATDCPAVEPYPVDPDDMGSLHCRAIALLGMPIGEQFNLESLAEDCAADGTYEFMVVSAPLYLIGGKASPPNAIVLK